ncbi:hypothetical protein CLV78_1247 [Aliiruegeria haliotis]|uniref:NAD(P)-dependent dehydrogenase (Short-subunit alcohol dehydrogenase family) n=1 Tax=Aliiruegeria haliotis TaxID=1280846 RepID=A0A2T0RE00_9RHOB|nr:SDR family oxidoreductase [Aliiruegeria haliotis]PRY19340.1 hypothetical protein CLV78_1247 [Aliiruegeria haliotis]
MRSDKLKGKVAVVTGAAGTLCSAMARDLAAQGCAVALANRTEATAAALAKELTEGGAKAIPLAMDVTDIDAVSAAAAQVREELGSCDILINGAGGNQMDAITTVNEYQPEELTGENPDLRGFFNLDMTAFRSVADINLMGTVIPSHAFGRDMAKAGGGAIVNIASMNTYRPLSRVAAYASAKAGVSSFTQWLAAYLAPANIRVNAIAPGFFLNDRSRQRLTNPDGTLQERGQNIINHTPMARFGEAEELVGCMNWLIDDTQSGFVTGITVPVDGGFLSSSGL